MTENDQRERTDRLETTLQDIESMQQTGILNVERAKGGVRETGSITFLYGQPVEATAGTRSGNDAFEWLTTWGSCRYVFIAKFPSEIVVSQPAPPPVQERTPTSPLALITQLIQKSIQPVTAAAQSVGNSLPQVPSTPTITSNISSSTPASTSQTNTIFQLYTQNSVPEPAVAPRVPTTQPLPSVPYRLLDVPDALAYIQRVGLSRLHRHVFLLLDGQRSLNDIVRLTNHPLREVQRLLSDLEQFGLIKRP